MSIVLAVYWFHALSLTFQAWVQDLSLANVDHLGQPIEAPLSELPTSDSSLNSQIFSNLRFPNVQTAADTTSSQLPDSLPYDFSSDNTLDGAINIGVLSGSKTFQNFVGSSDTQDYYGLNLSSGGNLNVSLTGLSADADVQVLNSAGAVIATSAHGLTHDEAINLSGLAADNYYVKVFQYSGDTNYNLNVSSSKPNDLLPAEIELGTLAPGSYTRTGNINNSNTADIYHFTLTDVSSTNNLKLSLTGLTADADIRIIRDNNDNGIVDAGEVITKSTVGGSGSESIDVQGLSTWLDKHDFFVEVYQYSGNTDYKLNLSVNANFGFAPEPNNTIAQAYDTGSLIGARRFSGHVNGRLENGSLDLADYYHFELGTTSNFYLSLIGSFDNQALNEDADVQVIRDSNHNGVLDAGEVISTAATRGTSSETISLDGLGVGDYYVKVLPYSNHATDYQLLMSAKPGNGFGSFFNQSMDKALDLDTLNGDRVYEGKLVGGDNDYYRFHVGATSVFNLTLDGLSADADVQLVRDTNKNYAIDPGEVIGSSTKGGTLAEAINTQLNPGDYFVRVYPYSGIPDYTLHLNATPT